MMSSAFSFTVTVWPALQMLNVSVVMTPCGVWLASLHAADPAMMDAPHSMTVDRTSDRGPNVHFALEPYLSVADIA